MGQDVVDKVRNLYEQDVLPWATRWLPRGLLQMHSSWCTMFYRLGMARLVLGAHSGDPKLFRGAVSAYEEALAETRLCMGADFAAPLANFVRNLQKGAERLPS